ncbi:MAG: hypothetical protein M0D57_00785 [Sphingobacteriales bacterium JAD_PAG50586_3]|nr:MAG: hypothetical protein M0D57_00785 [Sphingobacteriales bacterium JAD_PAG50586_3]
MTAFFFSLIIAFSATYTKDPIPDKALVDTLKKMYTIVSSTPVKPKEQDLIYVLLRNQTITTQSLSFITKIDSYLFKGKPNNQGIKPIIEFQIWELNTEENARLCFKIMKEAREDKPPKGYFQYQNKIYYFAAGSTYIYLEYGRKAYNKVVSYFDKTQIQQVVY